MKTPPTIISLLVVLAALSSGCATNSRLHAPAHLDAATNRDTATVRGFEELPKYYQPKILSVEEAAAMVRAMEETDKHAAPPRRRPVERSETIYVRPNPHRSFHGVKHTSTPAAAPLKRPPPKKPQRPPYYRQHD